MDVETRVKQLFELITNEELPEDTCDLEVDDLEGWDSVAHMNLILAIEEAFSVTFSESEIELSTHYSQLIEITNKKL